MRFTLSNGEQIEVRQPSKPTPRKTPPKNDKPARRGPRNKNRDPMGSHGTNENSHGIRENSHGTSKNPHGSHNPMEVPAQSPRRNRNRETKNRETNEIDNLASSVSKLISKRNKFMINADQRVVLLDKIKKNKLECAICMEKIKNHQAIWSCKNCYNILHLKCAKEWAQSTMNKDASSDGWRCPSCQHMDRFEGLKFF